VHAKQLTAMAGTATANFTRNIFTGRGLTLATKNDLLCAEIL
jgi:hypothetical protein